MLTRKPYSASIALDEAALTRLRGIHGQKLEDWWKEQSASDSIVLPGHKLATSKIPRMLTPSEIALLRLDFKEAIKYTTRKPSA